MPTPSFVTEEKLPDFVADITITGFHPFAKPDLAPALNRLYMAFGSFDDNVVFDGATRKVVSGVAPDTFVVSSAAPSGAGVTGRVRYGYTLYDPDADVETGPSADLDSDVSEPFPYVDLVAQDATFDIVDPGAGSRFTEAKVYRAPINDVTPRYLETVTIVPGAGNVTFDDDFSTTDDTLYGRDPIPIAKRYHADGLPPRFRSICFFEGRLYAIQETLPNRVLWSEASALEDFPVENHADLTAGREDVIPQGMAIRICNGQRYVYTRNAIYRITGASPPFGIELVVSGVGSQSTRATIALEGLGVIFPGVDKPYLHMGGSTVVPLGVVKEAPDMNPVEDLYQAYDAGRIKDAEAMVWMKKGRYVLSFGTDGSPVENRTLVWEFNVPGGGAWSEDSGRIASAMGTWRDVNGREVAVRGDELGQVWQDDLGDSEGAYAADVTSPIDLGDRGSLLPTGLSSGNWIYPGVPVFVIGGDGTIADRNRIWKAVSSSDIRLLYPWPGDIPEAPQTIEVGSIEWAWESGYFDLFRTRVLGAVSALFPYNVSQAGGYMRVFYGVNEGELILLTAGFDLTLLQDKLALFESAIINMKVRFEASEPGTTVALSGFDVDATRKVHRV